MSKFALIAVLVTASLGLAACNTVAGAGKDVSSVGKATTKAANDVKN
jgi:predicted small secreted protein